MASQLVVLDAALKRAVVKVTPQKYLSDVLEEACVKLGHDPQQYTLKHNNKNIDLSRSIRLSGLPNAAKLSLVQASRSPSVVSVALQLPSEEGQAPGVRLTDKFPNDTPIWQILRRFEAGAAGTAPATRSNINITQRATPQMSARGATGSGRLCYSTPVVNAMGRELASLVDLQKTLGQLGFNNGTCLLRLSFRNTDQPLEEAMNDISRYFKEPEQQSAPKTEAFETSGGPVEATQSTPTVEQPSEADVAATESPSAQDTEMSDVPVHKDGPTTSAEAEHPTLSQPQAAEPTGAILEAPKDAVAIFAPPSSSVPAAATVFNEEDYVPSATHALQHQARLEKQTRNKKLLSDKELADQEQARIDALKSVREVTVRIRFPDNAQAQRIFSQDATAADLYTLCRDLMHRPEEEDFKIRFAGSKGTETLVEDQKKLIQYLGWKGRVLVTVVWGENVTRRGPSLKQEHLERAQQLKVGLPTAVKEDDAPAQSTAEVSSRKEGKSGGDRESKMRGLLSRLSKK